MSIRNIRLTRAWPDRIALPPERRATYSAALQQFEELIEAAQVAGPASAPLPLFYALSQAGRAIAAAFRTTRWELQGHGIRCSANRESVALSATNVHKEVSRNRPKQDSFRGVSEAIGSPVPAPTAEIRLGDVFAAIESLSHMHDGKGKPIRVDGDHNIKDYNADQGIVLVMAEIPRDLRGVTDLRSAMRERLREYPQGSVLQVPGKDFLVEDPQKEGWIELFVRLSGAPSLHEDRDGWHVAADAALDEVVPRGPVAGDFRYLRAPIGGVVLHPLMAWWILLHGLSTLARYHPALWQQALDVDFSPYAVVLEAALEVASDDVPDLVFAALDRDVPPSILHRGNLAGPPTPSTGDAEAMRGLRGGAGLGVFGAKDDPEGPTAD